MAVESAANYRAYIEKLAEVSGVNISSFDDMIDALRKRHAFFAEQGCRLSDHGIEEFYAEDYTDAEIRAIFNKVYGGTELTKEEILKFKSAMLGNGLGNRLGTTISLRSYPRQQQQDVQVIGTGYRF